MMMLMLIQKSIKENSFTGLKTYTSTSWSKIIRAWVIWIRIVGGSVSHESVYFYILKRFIFIKLTA